MKIFAKKFWLSFLVDIGFLIFILFFALGSQLLAQYIQEGNLTIGSILVIAYFILLALFYCFAKYIIWKIILEKTKCKFFRWIIYNVIILFGFFIIFLVLTIIIIVAVQEQYLRIYIAVLVILFMICSYIVYGPFQLAILLKAEKKFWRIMQENFFKILAVILVQVILLIILYFIFLGIYELAKGEIDLNRIMEFTGFFVIILFNVYNRIYIYGRFKRSLGAVG